MEVLIGPTLSGMRIPMVEEYSCSQVDQITGSRGQFGKLGLSDSNIPLLVVLLHACLPLNWQWQDIGSLWGIDTTASGFAVFSHGLTRYKDAQSRFEGSEYGRACPAVIEFSASCVWVLSLDLQTLPSDFERC